MTDGFFFDPIKKPECNVYSMGIFLKEASTYDLERIKDAFNSELYDRVEFLGVDEDDDTLCIQVNLLDVPPVDTIIITGNILNRLNDAAMQQRMEQAIAEADKKR